MHHVRQTCYVTPCSQWLPSRTSPRTVHWRHNSFVRHPSQAEHLLGKAQHTARFTSDCCDEGKSEIYLVRASRSIERLKYMRNETSTSQTNVTREALVTSRKEVKPLATTRRRV